MAQLRETTYWVLTALAAGPRHGYALIEEVTQLSHGAVTLKVATLYPSLQRLEDEGLIRTAGNEVVGGRRRRYFTLTSAGAAALDAEATRLAEYAERARARLRAEGWGVAADRGAIA